MRFVLAFSCFFRMLFTGKLPASVADRVEGAHKALPDPHVREKIVTKEVPVEVTKEVIREVIREPKISASQHQRDGALSLLALLQREGRLVDFLRDTVDGASDVDVGGAAREVHRGCRKVLDQYLEFEPVMPGEDDSRVTVPKGFDPAEIRLVGEAKGEPPYKGTLRHHGWRVMQAKLPTLAEGVDRMVIAPAEVEL
ncbi:MAG: DUF2760 domain-containing protein [Proteobacteria bacterium]|nr:DUF2760 domain-containing protein [Pseudomonadota bacterium]